MTNIVQKKSPLEQEWDKLNKREQKFLQLRIKKNDSILHQKLEEKVPAKLKTTLDAAFAKAFGMIFEKGTGIIERTYKKEEWQKTFQINEFTDEVLQSKKSLKAFGKKAEGSGRVNLMISAAAGVGMGLLGVGIPDIPVFTGMVLKSIYEIALSYGYEYESEGERGFILMLIQGAVSYGREMLDVNAGIDTYIAHGNLPWDYEEKIQIEKTAGELSKELMYMKFLQGIPIVGAVGGIYDAVYMKRITEYANLKYKKRFLMKKKRGQIVGKAERQNNRAEGESACGQPMGTEEEYRESGL